MSTTCNEVNLSDFRSLVQVQWPKLSAEELDCVEEDPESLVDIVKDRYRLSTDEADRLVHEFEIKQHVPDFDSHKRRRFTHS